MPRPPSDLLRLTSSHLDSLYADLQVHALSVSDGLAKVLTALGSGSLTADDFREVGKVGRLRTNGASLVGCTIPLLVAFLVFFVVRC